MVALLVWYVKSALGWTYMEVMRRMADGRAARVWLGIRAAGPIRPRQWRRASAALELRALPGCGKFHWTETVTQPPTVAPNEETARAEASRVNSTRSAPPLTARSSLTRLA